mmetsp:Transcript_53347/g.79702  ORF Transcript_53347/g.79702 Transcript_53347/m.79702 type:complete len:212 (+) Transcript_53347:183-818(+)
MHRREPASNIRNRCVARSDGHDCSANTSASSSNQFVFQVTNKDDIGRRNLHRICNRLVAFGLLLSTTCCIKVTFDVGKQIAGFRLAKQQFLSTNASAGVNVHIDTLRFAPLERVHEIVVNVTLELARGVSIFPHLTLQVLEASSLHVVTHEGCNMIDEVLLRIFVFQHMFRLMSSRKSISIINQRLQRCSNLVIVHLVVHEVDQMLQNVGE